MDAAWQAFLALREASNSENALKILEAWAGLEKISSSKFELLQILINDVEIANQIFTNDINQALNTLSNDITSLELVDRPSIMEFAQVSCFSFSNFSENPILE
jgi:uncharacterized protein with PhoU and TrkA domain